MSGVVSTIPLVGIPGGVKNRLNILDFVQNEKFFTLYVLALQVLQNRNQGDYSSFFQLGGIHGLPFTEWAKTTPQLHLFKADYCTHGTVLFPTWHRTYESIWEQILWEAAQGEAQKFTTSNKAEWIQAAKDLRQPYWDWGYYPNDPNYFGLPDKVIKDAQVQITDYNGTKITVDNPILHYKFRPVEPTFEGDFAKWQTTMRYPNVQKQENISGMIEGIKASAPGLREWTFNMLTKNYTWELFSNHGATVGAHANSLEMVHNTVHFLVGRDPTLNPSVPGHMGSVPHAAFDPIFWMHHANVDRLLALWQAMNYDVWVSEGMNREGTMGLLPGQVLTENTPLEPFYTSSQDPWQSDDLEEFEKLGYSYPDFDGVKGASKEVKRKYINDLVRKRYGFVTSRLSNPALCLLSSFQCATSDHGSRIQLFDWTIHTTFRYYEFNDSFSVVFYFDDDGGYSLKNIIGTVDAFRGTTSETCANCASNQSHIAEGFVHLNYYIGRDIGTFDPPRVTEYLKRRKLSCRVLSSEGKLTSLAVEVKGAPFKLLAGESRPKLDKSLNSVTRTDLIHVIGN